MKLALVCSLFCGALQCLSAAALTPNDLLVSDAFTLQSPERISAAQAKSDIARLIYALENGYGGKHFPRDIGLNKALAILSHDVTKIKGSISVQDFCTNIDTALWQVQDDHLTARVGRQFCNPKRKDKFTIAPLTGRNVLDPQKVWGVSYIDVNKRRVPVISITRFESFDDPVWKGLLEQTQRLKESSPAIVIDMRGNGGGDDQIAIELAKQMFGGAFPNPIEKSVAPLHGARYALRANSHKVSELRLRANGKAVPEYLLENFAKQLNLIKAASLTHATESLPEAKVSTQFSPSKGFDRPIVILVDRMCASSCEHALEYFEAHPKTTTIGQNTAGLVHFGDTGQLVLPNSQITVQIPTKYIEYWDKRFVERTGYKPKVVVPDGVDSMNVAMSLLSKVFGE